MERQNVKMPDKPATLSFPKLMTRLVWGETNGWIDPLFKEKQKYVEPAVQQLIKELKKNKKQ